MSRDHQILQKKPKRADALTSHQTRLVPVEVGELGVTLNVQLLGQKEKEMQ